MLVRISEWNISHFLFSFFSFFLHSFPIMKLWNTSMRIFWSNRNTSGRYVRTYDQSMEVSQKGIVDSIRVLPVTSIERIPSQERRCLRKGVRSRSSRKDRSAGRGGTALHIAVLKKVYVPSSSCALIIMRRVYSNDDVRFKRGGCSINSPFVRSRTLSSLRSAGNTTRSKAKDFNRTSLKC